MKNLQFKTNNPVDNDFAVISVSDTGDVTVKKISPTEYYDKDHNIVYTDKSIILEAPDFLIVPEIKTVDMIVLSPSVERINSVQFCTNLTHIWLPQGEGTLTIADYAFNNLYNFIFFDRFGDCKRINHIGSGAFNNCFCLEYFANDLIEEGETLIDTDAFNGCYFISDDFLTEDGPGCDGYPWGATIYNTEEGFIREGNNFIKSGVDGLALFKSRPTIEMESFTLKRSVCSVPSSINEIKDNVFKWPIIVNEIVYYGSIEEWNNIQKGSSWKDGLSDDAVLFTDDGTYPISEL